jgi:hypothetical protein
VPREPAQAGSPAFRRESASSAELPDLSLLSLHEDAQLAGFGLPGRRAAARLSAVIGGLLVPHIIGSPVATAREWRIWFVCCIVMTLLFIPLCRYGLGRFYRPSRARAALLERSAAAQAAAAGVTGVTGAADARATGGQDQPGERPALDAT